MKTRKCKSYCSLQEPASCLTPKCILTHSKTRRTYCRIPSTHKLTPQCDVISRKETPLSQKKESPDYLLMGDSGECIAFGKQAYTWWEFFREYTTFKYVEDVYPIQQNHELMYLKEGMVSYARLTSTPHSLYEYIVGVRFINNILHRFPCFLYTYGLFYSTVERLPKLYRPRQLQTSLVQHGIECVHDNAYLLIQHLKDSVPLSSIPKKERLPLLFILYHALASLSSSFTHHDLIMKNVMVWRPHPTKYITYKYPGVTFQSPYVPKIVNFHSAYFSWKNESTETADACHTYDARLNPNKDVSLIRDAYPDLQLHGVSVNRVYQILKTLLPKTDHESIGTMTVRNTVTYVST
jgi:hypothetical protein